MATEITKIAGSDHPTVVWGPLATEPPRISLWTLYRPKAECPTTFLPLIVCVSLSHFRGEFQNRTFCTLMCGTAVQGHPRSLILVSVETTRKGLWDFLLVVNSNLGFISHHSEIRRLNGSKSPFFPTPSHLAPSVEMIPYEFPKKLYGSWN